MAWDGSGNFTRTNGTNTGTTLWADDAAAAIKITTTNHDTHDEDLKDGIDACITQNNESKPTAHFLPNADASYNLGSAIAQWVNAFFSGDVAAATGTFSGEVTGAGFTGTLDGVLGGGTPAAATVTTFTSTGIDDNATGERLEISDNIAQWGNAGVGYTLAGADDTQVLVLTGGVSSATGGSIWCYGDTHSTTPGDILFRSGNQVWGQWDESGGTLTLSDGTGAKTEFMASDGSQNVTFAKDVTSTAGNFKPLGTTAAGDLAAVGYASVQGLRLTGQGSNNDVTILNKTSNAVLTVPTGTTNVVFEGEIDSNGTTDSTSGGTGAIHTDGGIGAVKDIVTDANFTDADGELHPSLLQTPTATTSGTEHDFTGIPSWVKRVTIFLNGVSTNGTSIPEINIGDAGGMELSGYLGTSTAFNVTASSLQLSTGGFIINSVLANATLSGVITLTLANATNNDWMCSGTVNDTATNRQFLTSGRKSLDTALTQIRLTTTNGTDTFDAGEVNIMWE